MSAQMEYYGFSEAPFSLTPDPRFAYASQSHERALRTLMHALSRREGLIVVTGDIGCGKTTLCRRLLPLLPERTFLSLVLNPFLTADDLLRQVLEDYGIVSSDDLRREPLTRASCHELARTLQEFLNSLAQIGGTAVIIVDEAQNLPLRTLEQIRLLSNLETHTTKLLQIILVGQRNLEPILELEELRQLNQRVSRRCRVEPLLPAEVPAYIEHRLLTAMPPNVSPRVRFTPGALTTIAKLSRRVPRLINLICDRALEIGDGTGASTIDRRLVLEAAKDLELPVPGIVRIAPALRPAATGAVAAAGLVAAITAGAMVVRSQWPARAASLFSRTSSAAQAAVPGAQKPVLQLDALEASAAGRAATAPQAPPTVVESASAYELTVASFETATRANKVASDLVADGHPARVAASDSGRWQMVIVGPYTSLEEADEAKAALERSGFAGIKVGKSQ